ncbi:VanZ family protein [Priestia aryabhattai]|uniref:VanZ family protein n=1 Tax=Priestia aryabhattai TaxID=412384 RepID=UPI003CA06EC9
MSKNTLINILFLGSILFIMKLTIFPQESLGIGSDSGGINLVPFRTSGYIFLHETFIKFIINILGNIILFLPFGLFLTMRFKKINRLWKCIVFGSIFSISIEIVQLSIPNRWTDVDDVILNTLGTAIGYAIYKIIDKKKMYLQED